jgi:hypothetical protein
MEDKEKIETCSCGCECKKCNCEKIVNDARDEWTDDE